MSNTIVLYDLPSKQGKSWSYNALKARLVLNYKNIPYQTEWTEYPDLKVKLGKTGLAPNETGPAYTSPAIRLPDGSYLQGSRAIAERLEQLYPEPSLHLDLPDQEHVEELVVKFTNIIRPIFTPSVPKILLNPPSQTYFIEAREKRIGMKLDEFAKGAKKCVQTVAPVVKELGEAYEKNEGPFLHGHTLCYADLIFLGLLRMLNNLGEISQFYELEGGDKLKALYEAGKAKGLFDRDSY
ncbi:hypothetical protein PV08_09939 [Exophiala spinifera]|uniref:GST N-terminal domain-containing protein n=1 Tax=Exophiala spinifera TaxID=91928 RepID=A0A0D1YCK7_9EURO|nr:uncharacterized protein PV08_09939 [Exophiala spinifera]KIW12661.1 hypothetical protein PV08_09939 [Exophiala spinifera]